MKRKKQADSTKVMKYQTVATNVYPSPHRKLEHIPAANSSSVRSSPSITIVFMTFVVVIIVPSSSVVLTTSVVVVVPSRSVFTLIFSFSSGILLTSMSGNVSTSIVSTVVMVSSGLPSGTGSAGLTSGSVQEK